MRTAIFSAKYDQLDAIREFAAQAARDAGMDNSAIYAVELSMDEACTNIIEHAYEGVEGGEIECTCDSDNKKLTILIHDHGKSFDPSTIALPNLEADLDSRPVGGLGVFLMKKLMDEVRFEPLGEAGNVLTMVKHCRNEPKKAKAAQPPSAWKQIGTLGEELMKATSLTTQHDLIRDTTARILGGRVDLWLDKRLFRLPGLPQTGLFPSQPPAGLMMKAFSTGIPAFSAGKKSLMAVPLKNGGLVMGILRVERPAPPFRKKEIELLDGLAGHISLALVASHRFVIEQWRIEQLTLVRQVSAQIANVLDLNELTRRITKLIQRTFHYYYVAIFTCEPGRDVLNFRSSAGPNRTGGKQRESQSGGRHGWKRCPDWRGGCYQ